MTGGATPLGGLLVRRIGAGGPITLAEYMAECLLHPAHGYYATREPFGAGGDFITAPETSQVFGELLGLSLAQAWMDQGAAPAIALAELGPGRGTLMADVLRATRGVPGFHAALSVHLVEASARLRAVQAATLADTGAVWHDSIDSLPDLPLFLLANEFFDALPIRQFHRQPGGWSEVVVGLRDGALHPGLTEAAPLGHLAHRIDDTRTGDVVEDRPAGRPVMAAMAARIARNGGAGIIIDYGDWQGTGNTLQALFAKAFDDPLAHPGQADLTAHVDFSALARAAQAAGAAVSGPVAQGMLLQRLGLDARAERLAARLDGAALHAHHQAIRRLTDATEMGTLFKAISVHPPGYPPPGFGSGTGP